jgi:hypothetical protein
MGLRRWIIVGCTIGATLALPLDAAADGGAYIEFRRTHYLPGETAVGVAYVSIPEPQQALLERGPFYVYVVPSRGWIREGRPLPEGVIRVGTAVVQQDSGTTFEVQTSFAVPDLPGEYYNVQICNDPCTITGFRESLSAQISIVQTRREANLLNEQQRLFGKNWSLHRKLRQADKAYEELGASLEETFDRMVQLSAENSQLEAELEAATAPDTEATAGDARPLVEGWALVAIIVALLGGFVSVALIRRRGPTLVVPDTIAELDEDADRLAPR